MKKISLIFAFVILAVAMFAFNIFAGNVTKDDVVASGTMSGGGGVHHTQLGTKMFDGVTDCGGVYGWTGDAWYGNGASNHSITIKFNNTIELSSFAFHGISQNGSFKIEGLLNNAVVFTKTASLASGDSAYGKVEVIKLSEGLSYNVDAIKFTVVSAGNGGRYKISEFEIHKCNYIRAGEKTPVTCVTDGVDLYTCDCSRTKDVVVPASGTHSLKFNDKYEVQPSCGQAGTAIWECENCDYTETRTVGATGDHVYTEYVATVKEPTCVDKGLETRRCSCGAESDVETDATGEHSYSIFVDYVTEPTCVGAGVANYKCATCDATTPKTVDPTGIHDYSVSQRVTDPTCAQGYTTYKCANCDATENRDFTDPVYEHDFKLFRKTTKLPTYDEEGAMEYVCQACYTTTSKPIPKLNCGDLINIAGWATLDHKKGNWISGGELVGDWRITAPRIIDGNYGTGIGSSHHSSEVSIFLNFDKAYVFEEIVVYVNQTAAWGDAVSQDTGLTNLVSGKNQDFTFAICYYDANGNKIETHWLKTKDQTRIVVPGSNTPVAAIEYYVFCDYNNSLAVWEIEAFTTVEHFINAEEEGVVTAPTCTEEGYTTYTCKDCGESFNTDKKDALGHVMNDYRVKVPATCTNAAILEFDCAREGCGQTVEKPIHVDNIIDTADKSSIQTQYSGGGTMAGQIFDGNFESYTLAGGVWAVSGSINFDMPYYLSSVTVWVEGGSTNTGLIVYYQAPGSDEWIQCGAMLVPTSREGIHQYTLEITESVYADAIKVYVGDPDGEPQGGGPGLGSYAGRFYEVVVAGSILPEKAVGHNWVPGETVAATCKTYGYTTYTCSVCDATKEDSVVKEGNEYHTWEAATCIAPKTCSTCLATEGNKAEHTWADATCTAPKTCSVCGATEGEALGQHIYDLSNAVTDGNVITIACTNGCGAAATITVNGTKAQAGFNMMMQQAVVSVYAPGYGMLSATTSEGSSCFLITNPRLPAQSFTAPMIVNIDGFNDTYVIVPQFSSTDAAPSITITYEALTPATIVEGENTVDTSAGETKVQFVVTESGKYNFILNADAMVLTEYGAAGTHEGPFAYEAGDIAEIIIMTYGEPSVVITVEKVIEHVHSYTSSVTAPTCEAAGKTVYTCTCGDTYEESIPALGHTEVEIPAVLPTPSVTGYTAGVKCSECGETIKAPVEIIVTTLENERDADLNIGGANLSLQENIAVRYWAKVNTNMYKDHYMVFVFNNEEYVITENAYNNSYKMYGFRFEETFPQKMADNIEAYVYARTADGNYSRNKVLTYSVLQYCTRQLEKNNAALTTMISDVLTYGAMTQMYMNYKTNALVTNLVGDFTLTPTAFTTVPESVNKMGLIGDNTGATKWKGATVLYGSSTYVKILFNTENIDNLVININLAGSDKKFTKEDFKYDTTNKAYYIVVDYIKSYEYDETITATFIENGEQVYSTLTYSINTYIFRNYNKGSNNAQNLLKALYIYGVAISNYKW